MRLTDALRCAIVCCFAVGCAPLRPSVYQDWGAQLQSGSKTQDDVSFLLGSPPTRCEPLLEPAPIVGITVASKGDTTIAAVDPRGVASAAGLKAGDKVTQVNGGSVKTGADLLRAISTNLRWDEPLDVAAGERTYVLTPRRPIEAKQCYWEIGAGGASETHGVAVVNSYGGSAVQGGTAYQRFFRAACRFHDGYLAGCTANWQE